MERAFSIFKSENGVHFPAARVPSQNADVMFMFPLPLFLFLHLKVPKMPIPPSFLVSAQLSFAPTSRFFIHKSN